MVPCLAVLSFFIILHHAEGVHVAAGRYSTSSFFFVYPGSRIFSPLRGQALFRGLCQRLQLRHIDIDSNRCSRRRHTSLQQRPLASSTAGALASWNSAATPETPSPSSNFCNSGSLHFHKSSFASSESECFGIEQCQAIGSAILGALILGAVVIFPFVPNLCSIGFVAFALQNQLCVYSLEFARPSTRHFAGVTHLLADDGTARVCRVKDLLR